MDRIKRFIDVHVPVETCNFRCRYCYITHCRLFDKGLPTFRYSPDTVRRALSRKRLGGLCMFNLCGGGETLLAPEVVDYARALLEEGHYVMVVTNGSITQAFDRFAVFPPALLERLFFKFSYHFLQLRERGLTERFFANVRRMRDAGASFTVELTPSDEEIPFIDEIKAESLREVGAIPHITVARDHHDASVIPFLTKLPPEEYRKTWESFDSELFRFKYKVFLERRTEFCYAGDWTAFLNLGTGRLSQCYCAPYAVNILDDVEKPIPFKAIGHFCQQPHCYNAHAFMTFGVIPGRDDPTYEKMRNRVCLDKSEWLKPRMKAFMSQRLAENNRPYSALRRLWTDAEMLLRVKAGPFLARIRKHIPGGK
ncbi:MAG: radical SAM protein [Kiritimatiellae bacterium]|nr:radical SAM protein [Kiritimatiellia bacterium]